MQNDFEIPDVRRQPPPWTLSGSAVVLPSWRGTALALVHYTTSPVGQYDELAVVGLRGLAPSVKRMWVTSEASRAAGRGNWGFPKELADLHWQEHADRLSVQFNDRRGGTCPTGRWWIVPWGPCLPLRVRGWCVQWHKERLVKVPVEVAARVQPAWCGRCLGLLLHEMELKVLAPQPTT